MELHSIVGVIEILVAIVIVAIMFWTGRHHSLVQIVAAIVFFGGLSSLASNEAALGYVLIGIIVIAIYGIVNLRYQNDGR